MYRRKPQISYSPIFCSQQIEIDIEPTDKVERIKERVEEKEGIPPQQQRLIFSGKQMNDEKTAQDYKVQGGSVLHLVLALRGGLRGISCRLWDSYDAKTSCCQGQ
ncbi:hypothetical protein QAD02_007929 [Eretmocerus hayati]|uniref:Uncharacterized protein n=1 Tax=Eretmocerus hayati TaxID=131215 RepID=A0ACC2N7G3_9HYME|nr:hypothetical protein QAD02_007929 [Eretmocerus hayati]